jgi:Putative zinc-finger
MWLTMRTCKEIAALVVAREDRSLAMGERLELRAHMWICKACPGFEQQILTMRNALRQWRNYTGDNPAADIASKPAARPADNSVK